MKNLKEAEKIRNFVLIFFHQLIFIFTKLRKFSPPHSLTNQDQSHEIIHGKYLSFCLSYLYEARNGKVSIIFLPNLLLMNRKIS